MTGSEICTTIISTVKERIHSDEFREKYRIGNCFTRIRKLTMGIVMMFLLCSKKKSLPNEIDDFLNSFGGAIAELIGKPVVSFTKQAISKARKGISLDAFYWLLDISVSTFFKCEPSCDLWHGLHLFAIDGTDVQLPMVRQCATLFGSQRLRNSSEFPFGKGSYLYSVSTRLIVDALLETSKYSERELAMRHMDRFRTLAISAKSVVLMDRGYFSRELCEFLSNSNLFYVFRLKNNPKFLKAFKTSKKRTAVIDLNENLDTDEKLLVRILRFRLETGEYEYLATNLFDRKYTIDLFKELYFQRWPIETKFKQVKGRFQLENFSGYSEEAIDQDFLIAVFYCNLLEILRSEADKQISDILASEDCNRKYQYAAGEGILASRLKAYLPNILSGLCDIGQQFKRIITCAVQRSNWTQVIPGRHYARHVQQPGRKYCHNSKDSF